MLESLESCSSILQSGNELHLDQLLSTQNYMKYVSVTQLQAIILPHSLLSCIVTTDASAASY